MAHLPVVTPQTDQLPPPDRRPPNLCSRALAAVGLSGALSGMAAIVWFSFGRASEQATASPLAQASASSLAHRQFQSGSCGWQTQKDVAGLLIGRKPTAGYLAVVHESDAGR